VIGQHPRYAFDDKGKIPRQEDHHLDCISHVIDAVADESVGTPCGQFIDL
jgi:hypothetical protein